MSFEDILSKKIIVVIVAAVVLGFVLPFSLEYYYMSIMVSFFIYSSFSQSWNLMGGHANQISLGHTIFLGLGAYVTFLTYQAGYPVYLGLILGGLASAGVALVLSKPLFRFRGAYFSIATLAVSQFFLIWFNQWDAVGAATGLHLTLPDFWTIRNMYYIGLIIFALTCGVVWYALRSKLGWGLRAIRDDEFAAEMIGVDLFKSKVYTFLISAFLMALVGGLIGIYNLHLRPSAIFNVRYVLLMLSASIIGGMRTTWGPILGGAILVGLTEALVRFPGIQNVILGFIVLIIMLRAREGILGYVQKKFGISFS